MEESMDVRLALRSQYHAALKALREAIEKCPDGIWNDGSAPCWRVAYHTLFYAHFYLQQSQEVFTPWSRHRPEAECISSGPHETHRPPEACEPFTRAEFLNTATSAIV
jgi:hypothetical protein